MQVVTTKSQTIMKQKQKGIAAAVSAAGSQQKLAEQLGVTQQAIAKWFKQGFVPLRRAQEIEALFGVSRARLINPRLLDLIDAEVPE
jgi:DNA-binding transcriptional regulator YdaS (Cro superfamily)